MIKKQKYEKDMYIKKYANINNYKNVKKYANAKKFSQDREKVHESQFIGITKNIPAQKSIGI